MAVGGICQYCGRSAIGLISCNVCGGRVCPQCKLVFGCKICGGIKKV